MIKLFAQSQILKNDETLTVTRIGATVYQEGKAIHYDPIVFQIIGNVQPLNGRQLLLVPEHDRYKEQYWVYIDNSQFTNDKGLEVDGPSVLLVNDRVTRLCANYQIQEVENWGTYCRVRIMRIDVGPDRTP